MNLPKTTGFLIAGMAGVGLVSLAQQPKQLTARELFYSASASAKPSPPRSQDPPPPAPKKAPPKATQIVDTAPPAGKQPSPPKGSTAPVSTTSAPIVLATDRPATAPAPVSGPPLGLRYTVLKRSLAGMEEVPVNTIFRAGDKIQLKVEANIPGYLYIISQGSSGTWKPMFPSPEVEEGNNRVDGWRAYTMPPKSVMTFDEQKGDEKIFIILA